MFVDHLIQYSRYGQKRPRNMILALDRRTDGWMDGRTDRWTNQWTDLIEMCSLQTHIKTRRIVTVMFMFRISCSCRCSICQFGSSQTYLDSNTNSDSGSDLHCDLNDSYQFVKQESGFGYIYSISKSDTLLFGHFSINTLYFTFFT